MKSRKTKLLIFFVISIGTVAIAIAWYFFRFPVTSHSIPNANGECPRSYVNYGNPLGCITKEEYENCKKNSTCPICLSSLTEIDTQNGKRVVTSLKKGDLVWSVNNRGQRALVPITQAVKRKVPQETVLLNVALQDGRKLYISPNHPTAQGETFGQLKVGDKLNGSTVVGIVEKQYSDGYTYDILPGSSTGQYWANDVLVGSTLTH